MIPGNSLNILPGFVLLWSERSQEIAIVCEVTSADALPVLARLDGSYKIVNTLRAFTQQGNISQCFV